MKVTILVLGATALCLAPTYAASQTAPGNGQYNGTGYNHMNSGNAYGQPDQSCEDLIASDAGAAPGNAADAPGQGSPFSDNTKSGARYAGSATQNSRNTASVSQYDVACSNQMPL